MEGLISRPRWVLLMVCRHLVCDVESADDLVFLASADSNAMTGQCMHLVSLLSIVSKFTIDDQNNAQWIG